jgi:methylated-DNA-protein-cysteine methyltransferase-like protein
VTTYGAIARIAGLDRQARLVGYALSALQTGSALPWHRVINAQGKLSLELAGSSSGLTQRLRLEKEGVRVDAAGRVSLAQFGWRVREPASRTKRRSVT